MELGKVYLDLGYLTQSWQVYHRALDIAKELDSDKPNLQVNITESSICSKVALLLALYFVIMYTMCCAVSSFRISCKMEPEIVVLM